MNELAMLRKKRNLSQGQVAKRLGITRSAVSKWEVGKGLPSSDKLYALAKLYRCSIGRLLCPKGQLKSTSDEKKGGEK